MVLGHHFRVSTTHSNPSQSNKASHGITKSTCFGAHVVPQNWWLPYSNGSRHPQRWHRWEYSPVVMDTPLESPCQIPSDHLLIWSPLRCQPEIDRPREQLGRQWYQWFRASAGTKHTLSDAPTDGLNMSQLPSKSVSQGRWFRVEI